MISIREATVDDVSAIAYVHIASWREMYAGLVPTNQLMNLSYDQQVMMWTDLLNSTETDMITLVAVDERGKIVGFSSAGYKGKSASQAQSAELYAVHLLKDYQHCGIGQRLVCAVISYFLENAVTSMKTWVLVDNFARGFYEANGGVVVDHKPVFIAQTELWEVCYAWFDLHEFGVLMQEDAFEQVAMAAY